MVDWLVYELPWWVPTGIALGFITIVLLLRSFPSRGCGRRPGSPSTASFDARRPFDLFE